MTKKSAREHSTVVVVAIEEGLLVVRVIIGHIHVNKDAPRYWIRQVEEQVNQQLLNCWDLSAMQITVFGTGCRLAPND